MKLFILLIVKTLHAASLQFERFFEKINCKIKI